MSTVLGVKSHNGKYSDLGLSLIFACGRDYPNLDNLAYAGSGNRVTTEPYLNRD